MNKDIIVNKLDNIEQILLQADKDKEIVFEVLLLIKAEIDKIREVL